MRGKSTRLAKQMMGLVAFVMVSWRLIIYLVTRQFIEKDIAFAAASESIGRIPGLRGVYFRQAFYRRTLAFCGEDIYFGWHSVFSKAGARLGNGVYIGRRCTLGLVEVGAETMLSDGVQVLSGGRQHGFELGGSVSYKEQPQSFSRVRIGPNAWLGTNAVIMADVGESSIIGAGAVVTEAIPDRVLAAGVPAKVKRRLD